MSATYLAINGEIVQSPSSGGGGGGGGGSSGHNILDNEGNVMTTRPDLQMAGYLQTTDDSTNEVTIVDDSPTPVTWTVWQTMTSAQKAGKKWLITDAPGADGEVEIETMHLAWENPNPRTAFEGKTFTFDISACPDYEKARIEFTLATGGVYKSVDIPRNQSGVIDFAWKDTGSPNQAGNLSRVFTISNDNTIAFENASFTEYNSITIQNNLCIPQKIYIYKKNLTARIKSIATNVSTLASNCMMSDEQTSVEEAISNSTIVEKIVVNSSHIASKVFSKLPKAISVSAPIVASNNQFIIGDITFDNGQILSANVSLIYMAGASTTHLPATVTLSGTTLSIVLGSSAFDGLYLTLIEFY